MLNPTTKPLNVALLSISAHNRAILEFFFAGAGRQLFTTTDLPQADALIVDFDHPGAEQEWAEFTRTQPRPAIILSIREISAPNTVWVPKPLTSQSLTNAAARIRALLPRNAAPPAPTREEAVSPPLTAAPPGTPFGLGEHRRRTVPRTRQPQPLVSRSEEAPDAPITPRPPAPPKTTDTAPSPSARLEEAGLSPPAPAEKPAPARDSGPSPEEAQRWQQLCGTEEGQISIRTWHESARLFTPENYLLNT
nr:hypothetical protein [Thiolinea sp.]